MQLVKGTVYELYVPPNGQEAKMDIVFFHGLQLGGHKLAWYNTWVTSNPKEGKRHVCWPEEWLAKEFPEARILSASYDTSAFRCNASCFTGCGSPPKTEQINLFSIADNLLHNFFLSDAHMGERPLVLVGHSLGGLVLQALCCAAVAHSDTDKSKRFLQNIKSVCYYSTPHAGSYMADYVGFAADWGLMAPVVKILRTWDSDREAVLVQMAEVQASHMWDHLAFGEKDPSTFRVSKHGRQGFQCISCTNLHLSMLTAAHCKPMKP